MKCSIHFYLINDLFSEEFADEHHDGEESADNRRYQWEDELSITTDVHEILPVENAVYPLMGSLSDGKPFKEEVGGMHLFELKGVDGISTYVGCSSSILDAYDIGKADGELILSVFLKDNEPMANPIPGIYIASKEFPKSLIV